MSKTLIYGGFGFVGASLVPHLVKSGRELIVVDKQDIPNCLGTYASRIKAYKSDNLGCVDNIQDIREAICLAGATSVDAALEDPAPAHLNNVGIAVSYCEWLRTRHNRVKAIYMSSDEVLGESFTPLGVTATLNPTQPYAASKAAAEIIVHDYRDVYHLEILTLRSCNLVGPYQRKPKLIPMIIEALKMQSEIPIHGDGTQSREWMGVEDLSKAISCMLDRGVTGIYHAASGVHMSVNDIVSIVCKLLHKERRVRYVKDRIVQDRSYSMDNSSLRSLGWNHGEPLKRICEAAMLLWEAE